jgi:hypothetical protein
VALDQADDAGHQRLIRGNSPVCGYPRRVGVQRSIALAFFGSGTYSARSPDDEDGGLGCSKTLRRIPTLRELR